MPCHKTVHGSSGYCLCSGNLTVARVSCGPHKFKCQDKCAELAYDRSGAVKLPEPLTCGADEVYDVKALGITVNFSTPASALDKARLDATAEQLWDRVDAVLVNHALDSIEGQMPPERTNKVDWVKEGYRLKEGLLGKLEAGVAAYRSSLPPYPQESFSGRGIVVVGGGLKYFLPAWVSLHALRRTGCTLPVELWFPVTEYPPESMDSALAGLGVTARRFVQRDMGQQGFTVKVAALLLSRFQEVIFLDSDNIVLRDPSYLFDTLEYRNTGALLWGDFWDRTAAPETTRILNISASVLPQGTFESGQMVIDKGRHWRGLLMAVFMNTNARIFYELLTCYIGKGDKETFAYGMLAAGEPLWKAPRGPAEAGLRHLICKAKTAKCATEFLGNTMVQKDPAGEYLFFHTNYQKWDLKLPASFADWHRRWQVLLPGSVDLVQDLFPRLVGHDLEEFAYRALRAFRCAPWFPHYYATRLRMGDKAMPGLDGFHELPSYLVFKPNYRKGWTGDYMDMFSPSLGDRLASWYLGGLRWKLRPIERKLKKLLKKKK